VETDPVVVPSEEASQLILATSPTCSCATADWEGYDARSNGQVAAPIEMLVEVITVTGPSALTEVVVPGAPDEDADATAVAVVLPLVDASVTVLEDFPFAPEVTDTLDPFSADVPEMASAWCLIRRRTLPRQSIVTLSPRAKFLKTIALGVGSSHVSPPTLMRERSSLVISPVVVCGRACRPRSLAAADPAMSEATPTTAMTVTNERTTTRIVSQRATRAQALFRGCGYTAAAEGARTGRSRSPGHG
jgi:hypothetical protein